MIDFSELNVYANIYGFGRTKSVSYRMWKSAKNLMIGTKIPSRDPITRKFKKAVRAMKNRGN